MLMWVMNLGFAGGVAAPVAEGGVYRPTIRVRRRP